MVEKASLHGIYQSLAKYNTMRRTRPHYHHQHLNKYPSRSFPVAIPRSPETSYGTVAYEEYHGQKKLKLNPSMVDYETDSLVVESWKDDDDMLIFPIELWLTRLSCPKNQLVLFELNYNHVKVFWEFKSLLHTVDIVIHDNSDRCSNNPLQIDLDAHVAGAGCDCGNVVGRW